MLAQNFKAAADLGIKDVELDALIKVLGMLERGEITKGHFAMASWDCGTTACLCGWARRVGGDKMFANTWHANKQIFRLFGGGDTDVIECRNPAQAAIALRSYLTTGEANWAEALA